MPLSLSLIVSDSERLVRVWRNDPPSVAAATCGAAGESLMTKEWQNPNNDEMYLSSARRVDAKAFAPVQKKAPAEAGALRLETD